MLKILKNKKIIISAGASGIGWATAKVCLAKGATVYLCDIEKKYLNKAAKHPQNKKKLFIYECDASDEYDVLNFFNQVQKKTKKIDALINNVGVAGPTGTLEKLSSGSPAEAFQRPVLQELFGKPLRGSQTSELQSLIFVMNLIILNVFC